jgi:hypothetical protein
MVQRRIEITEPLLLKGTEGIIQFALAGIDQASNEVNKKNNEE